MAAAETLPVEVVYCPAAGVDERVQLHLPPGATLADALHASGLLVRHQLALQGLRCGIWNHRREPGTQLREGDRVEIYRALAADPKDTRRRRQLQQPQRVRRAAR